MTAADDDAGWHIVRSSLAAAGIAYVVANVCLAVACFMLAIDIGSEVWRIDFALSVFVTGACCSYIRATEKRLNRLLKNPAFM